MPGPAALLSARTKSSSCSRTSRMMIDIVLLTPGAGGAPSRRGQKQGAIIAWPPACLVRSVLRRRRVNGLLSVTFGLHVSAPGRLRWGMPLRVSHTQLLRYAGLFTWAVVGIPLVFNSWYFPVGEVDELAAAPDIVGSTVAYFIFGAAYWLVTRDLGLRRPRSFDTALLAV